ncbi:MAG: ATP-binding protein [Mycobacterium sp.]
MKLTVGGGSGALDEVQSALETAWAFNAHVPGLIRMQVSIAVTEIAANIIEHARAVSFQIEVHVRPGEVEVELTDDGHPAEIDLAAVRMPGELAERGRGLAMAQAAVRLVSYARDELGNHWRVVSKRFSG